VVHEGRILKPVGLAVLAMTVALAAQAGQPHRFREQKTACGELRYLGEVPVLLLNETFEGMDAETGALMAEPLLKLEALCKRIRKERGLEPAWPLLKVTARGMLARMPPEYRREVKAFAAATKIDEDILTVANTMGELPQLRGCSSFVVQGDRSGTAGPLVGHNWDQALFEQYGLVTVLRPKGKHALVSVGLTGFLGVGSGMNDAGLVVSAHSVLRSKDEAPKFDFAGMPIHFCYRRLLEECETLEEAEKLFRTMKPSAYNNLLVCDRRGAAVFEFTPKNMVVRRPAGDVLACTNHFRSPELSVGEHCRRYDVLEKSMNRPRYTWSDVKQLLHAVNQGRQTVQTKVFEPAALRVRVAMGQGPVTQKRLTPLEIGLLFSGRWPDRPQRPRKQPRQEADP
jgi:isopenicillin-N N-acyltransferase-like protein